VKKTLYPSLAFACLFSVFLPFQGFSQYEILAGQTTGDSVHYLDIDPDYYNTASPFPVQGQYQIDFDINNDATLDLKFSGYACCGGTSTDEHTRVEGFPGTEIVVEPVTNFPDTLNLNDSIHGGLLWASVGELEYSYGFPGIGGIWPGVTDKYLGFRTKVNGTYFYGWFRLTVGDYLFQSSAELTIKDYGWRGDGTAVGINEGMVPQQIRLFPNPADDVVRIDFSGISQVIGLEVLDMQGRSIHAMGSSELIGSRWTELSCADWPAGIYLVKIESGSGHHFARILKR
jgi:hypothetical protein